MYNFEKVKKTHGAAPGDIITYDGVRLSRSHLVFYERFLRRVGSPKYVTFEIDVANKALLCSFHERKVHDSYTGHQRRNSRHLSTNPTRILKIMPKGRYSYQGELEPGKYLFVYEN